MVLSPQIDLSAAASAGSLVLSAETREDPLDQQHRHEQETEDGALRRWKERVRFSLVALLLAAMTGVALYLALAERSSPEEKAWGRSGLMSILTGAVGYLVGRGSKE